MWRERIVIWGAWALVGTVVTAQSPAPARPGHPAEVQAQSVTLTGCLKAWDASTMGPPPAAMATAAPVLVLTEAENAATAPGAPPPVADPAKPPSGGAPASGGHSTYLLKPASPTVNLASHLDHRVELSGTLATDHAAATPAAPTAPPGSSAAAAASSDRRGRAPAPPVVFTVDRVKMIDKACPAK